VRAAASERGQAALELLGVLPVLVALGLGLAQLLAVGYAAVLAGNAAEAGALARAARADAAASARNALPGWTRAGASVRASGGRVTVRLRPPSLVAALARRLEVSSTASVAR
jgi:pilus assembly protein CpaE